MRTGWKSVVQCGPTGKIMRFTYEGRRIELHGVKQQISQCPAITFVALQGLFSGEAVQHYVQFKWESDQAQQSSAPMEIHALNEGQAAMLPQQIQSLLGDYVDLFQEPTSISPQTPFDRHIRLLPKASPVNIRPYKYSPAQKDEIEKQIAEMMKNGIIKSQSPYASPVLLVKKKDGT